MSLIAELKSKVESELTALKADGAAIEQRIETAFGMGVVQAKLDAIVKDVTTVEEKVQAAYELGKAAL